MKEHLVRRIKKFDSTSVLNAMLGIGYWWKRNKSPTNIEAMLIGMPRVDLVVLLETLERTANDSVLQRA